MKKMAVALLLVLAIILSGCSVFKLGDRNSELKSLQKLGLAYKEGTYSMEKATVTGCITANQTVIWLEVPVGKKLLEGQRITVTAVTGAYLRTVDGKLVLRDKAELTPYIEEANIRNDGAVIFVTFRNSNKWKASDGKTLTNNTPITGTIDIEFTVSDKLYVSEKSSLEK